MERTAAKRDRSSNFTLEETNRLVDIVLKHASVIESKKTDACTWQGKESTWGKVTTDFNASVLIPRTQKALKIKYEGYDLDSTVLVAGTLLVNIPQEVLPSAACDKEVEYETNNLDFECNLQVPNTLIGISQENSENNKVLQNLTMISLPNDEIDDNTENLHKNKENSTSPTAWSTWTPRQLRKPVKSKLDTSKRVVRKDELNNKFSNLADSRTELLQLQLQIAQKDIELKTQLLENAKRKNERREGEHELEMKIKNKILENIGKDS